MFPGLWNICIRCVKLLFIIQKIKTAYTCFWVMAYSQECYKQNWYKQAQCKAVYLQYDIMSWVAKCLLWHHTVLCCQWNSRTVEEPTFLSLELQNKHLRKKKEGMMSRNATTRHCSGLVSVWLVNGISMIIYELLYLNIVVVRWKALRLLWCDIDIRSHQGSKETLQLLLDPPQLILPTVETTWQLFLINVYRIVWDFGVSKKKKKRTKICIFFWGRTKRIFFSSKLN